MSEPHSPTATQADSVTLGPEAPLKKLRFVWKPDEKEPKYALSPLPSTYEEAVAAATRLFHRHITNPEPSNIVLKCADRNRKGDFVWCSIEPSNWSILVGDGDEIAVFELLRKNEASFISGLVYLTFGKETGVGKIKWVGQTDSGKWNEHQLVGRPKNYQVAVETVKAYYTAHSHDANMSSLRDINIDTCKFEFFDFHNDNWTVWSSFPPAAYTNDDIWRLVVPTPGNALGVMLRKGDKKKENNKT